MNHNALRQLALLSLLLLVVASASGQSAAPTPKEQFSKAAHLMEKGQYAEVRAAVMSILAGESKAMSSTRQE